eukprot:9478294-Pyramimonas_sp.AAC.1
MLASAARQRVTALAMKAYTGVTSERIVPPCKRRRREGRCPRKTRTGRATKADKYTVGHRGHARSGSA